MSAASNPSCSTTLHNVGEITMKGNLIYWTVFNFLDIPLCSRTQIWSPRFRWKEKESQLAIWPNLWSSTSLKGCLGIYYYNRTDNDPSLRVRFGILGRRGEMIRTFDAMAFDNYKRFRVRQFILRSEVGMRKAAPQGHLKIFCGIRKQAPIITSPRAYVSRGDLNPEFRREDSGTKPASLAFESDNSKEQQQLIDKTVPSPYSKINASKSNSKLLSDEKTISFANLSGTVNTPHNTRNTKPGKNNSYGSQSIKWAEKEVPQSLESEQVSFSRDFPSVCSEAHQSSFQQPLSATQTVTSSGSKMEESYSMAKESSCKRTPGFLKLPGISYTSNDRNNTTQCRNSCEVKFSKKLEVVEDTSWLEDLCYTNYNFIELYLSGQYSDTTIKVKGCDFRVHQSIMRIRCPNFAAKHFQDLENSGTISVEDIDPAVFREFILFLYTGDVESISPRNVQDLYYVADKYNLSLLKDECIEYMKNHIVHRNLYR